MTHNITNGPSKFDLMIALFHQKGVWEERNHHLRFETEEGRTVWLTILKEVGLVDDSHENFFLKGYTDGKKVEATFDTRSRKGVIEIGE